MPREKTAIPDDLLQLSQRLEAWRRENPPRTRLPEPIWVAAAEMAQRHGLGCLTVLGKPLPDGRGSVVVALTSQGLPSRDRQGAVSGNQNPENG